MATRGTITYTGMDALKPQELRRAVKQQLQAVADAWHSNILPRHFKRGAKQRYGYQERKASYNKRKEKRYGHRRPLEYTGQLKRQVLRKARISGTSKRATVSMDAPRYMYQYKPGAPDKAAEITAVTQDEAESMAIQLNRNLVLSINSDKRKRTVKV